MFKGFTNYNCYKVKCELTITYKDKKQSGIMFFKDNIKLITLIVNLTLCSLYPAEDDKSR